MGRGSDPPWIMGKHKEEKKEKKENYKQKSKHERRTSRYVWVIDQV